MSHAYAYACVGDMQSIPIVNKHALKFGNSHNSVTILVRQSVRNLHCFDKQPGYHPANWKKVSWPLCKIRPNSCWVFLLFTACRCVHSGTKYFPRGSRQYDCGTPKLVVLVGLTWLIVGCTPWPWLWATMDRDVGGDHHDVITRVSGVDASIAKRWTSLWRQNAFEGSSSSCMQCIGCHVLCVHWSECKLNEIICMVSLEVS